MVAKAVKNFGLHRNAVKETKLLTAESELSAITLAVKIARGLRCLLFLCSSFVVTAKSALKFVSGDRHAIVARANESIKCYVDFEFSQVNTRSDFDWGKKLDSIQVLFDSLFEVRVVFDNSRWSVRAKGSNTHLLVGGDFKFRRRDIAFLS